jgi:predicted SnoaL-like aldol condensation-catalyzing enzyme
MARVTVAVGAALISIASGCTTTTSEADRASGSCDASAKRNREIVLAFYNEGLVGLRPRAAFERHMAPDFIEHKPDVPRGTRDAAATYLEALIANVPEPRWTVVRTIAEGELVFLHGRFTPAPGAPPYAVADVFRVQGCKIVEHWDVVAPPPKEQLNPNPRF